jgi:hypothetical protein
MFALLFIAVNGCVASSHAQAPATPDKEAATPDKEAVTPDKEAVTPDKEAVTPDKEAATPGKEAAPPGKEAATPGKEAATRGKEDWSQVKAMNRELRRQASDLTGRVKQTTLKKTLRSIRGSGNPAKVFEWVRENIRFEPYPGSMRGALGVLMSGSGNSVDQALLLGALYRAGGVRVRFAYGRVYGGDAKSVLEAFRGEASVIGSDSVPTNSWNQELGVFDDHVWVEVWHRGKFVAADPVLSSDFGVAKAQFLENVPEISADRLGTMEVILSCRLQDDQTRTLLTMSGPVSAFANRSLSLSFSPDLRLKSSLRPALSVEAKRKVGGHFPLDSLEHLELRYRLQIGNIERRWEQTLYRSTDHFNPFDVDQPYFAILVLPGWTASRQLLGATRTVVEDSLKVMNWAVQEGRKSSVGIDGAATLNEIHRDLGLVIGLTYAVHLDRLIVSLAESLGVTPFFDSPRIITTGIFRRGRHYRFWTETKHTGIRGVSKRGVPAQTAVGFVALVGHLANRLNAILLDRVSDSRVGSTARTFRAAAKSKVPVKTITPMELNTLEKLKIGAEARASITRSIKEEGALVLVTKRPVEDEGKARSAWWSLNPSRGHLSGGLTEFQQGLSGETDENSEGCIGLACGVSAAQELIRQLMNGVQGASDQRQDFREEACDSSKRIRTLARSFCAVRKSVPLPDIDECVGTVNRGERDMFATPSCVEQTLPLRCGAVLVNAFLQGSLTAMRPALKGDFEAGASGQGDANDGPVAGFLCD